MELREEQLEKEEEGEGQDNRALSKQRRSWILDWQSLDCFPKVLQLLGCYPDRDSLVLLLRTDHSTDNCCCQM